MLWSLVAITGCFLVILLAGYAISLVALNRFRSTPVPCDPGTPTMSLIIPIKGADRFTQRNLQAAAQAGAEVGCEVIVAMEEATDPAYTIATRTHGLRIALSGPSGDRSGKVHNMAAGVRSTQAEILAFMDADVELRPEALRAARARLSADPSLGAVSAVPYYRETPGPGGALARLYMHSAMASFIGQAWIKQPPNLIGGFMAIGAADLQRLGGIEAYVYHLSDDGAIGRDLIRAGKRLAMLPVVLYMDNEPATLKQGLGLVRKWYRVTRAHLGLGMYWLMLGFSPVSMSVLFALALRAVGLPAAGVLAVGLAVGLRALVASRCEAVLGLNRHSDALLAPLCDLLGLLLWFEALPARTITWKGRTYRMRRDGTVTPV